MDDLKRLLAIEEIKVLKARYCRLMDEKKWDEWREVFTSDAVMILPEGGKPPQIVGREKIVDFVSGLLHDPNFVSVHHIHAPEIQILSEEEASGIWVLDDDVRQPPDGPGQLGRKKLRHYRDKFRQAGLGWLISEIRLTQVPLDKL